MLQYIYIWEFWKLLFNVFICMTISSFNSLCFISLEEERATDRPGGHLHLMQLKLSFINRKCNLLKQNLRVLYTLQMISLYPCSKRAEFTFRHGVWSHLCLSKHQPEIHNDFLAVHCKTCNKGMISLGWLNNTLYDQSCPNHHAWGTQDHLSLAKIWTRINFQQIFQVGAWLELNWIAS